MRLRPTVEVFKLLSVCFLYRCGTKFNQEVATAIYDVIVSE